MKKNGKVFERWHYIILRITSKNLLVKFLNPGATQTSFTVKKVSIFFPQVTSYKKTHFNNFPVFLFFLLLKRKTQNKHFTQFQFINNIFLAKFQKNLSKRNFIFLTLLRTFTAKNKNFVFLLKLSFSKRKENKYFDLLNGRWDMRISRYFCWNLCKVYQSLLFSGNCV